MGKLIEKEHKEKLAEQESKKSEGERKYSSDIKKIESEMTALERKAYEREQKLKAYYDAKKVIQKELDEKQLQDEKEESEAEFTARKKKELSDLNAKIKEEKHQDKLISKDTEMNKRLDEVLRKQ